MNFINKIIPLIKRHKKLDYIQQCIRKINDGEFVQSVLDISTYPSLIKFQELGPLNKNINIYVIKEGHPSGLFGLWSVTMQKLNFAERYGLVPVIEWTKSTLFYDKEMNETRNVYEYYFKNPSNISLEDAKHSYNVAFMRYADKNDNKSFVSYQWTNDDIEKYAKLQSKYIKLNEKTNIYVKNGIDKMIGNKKILGVHVRGTDFNISLKNHPQIISTTDYLNESKRIFSSGKYDRIFIATDDLHALKLFQQEFKKNLLYYEDVYRSDNYVGPHCSKDNRTLHKYWLGMEVIRDAYTLAACDALIAGESNVSFAARVIKKANNKNFTECIILNKGLHTEDSKEGCKYRNEMNKYYKNHE